VSFLELYSLARIPEATVTDHLRLQGSSFHWDIAFIRAVQDWELEAVTSFMELLYLCFTIQGGSDFVRWSLSSSSKFDVKSYYKKLTQVVHSPFPWRIIWKAKVPNRVAFFTWTAALGKILTIDNLRRRKVIILD
jgi:hypothetical protein